MPQLLCGDRLTQSCPSRATKVRNALVKVLTFLTNDEYLFDFVEVEHDREKQGYLCFGNEQDWPFYGVSRVVMFSGGLDSLAGAVDTVERGENLVLVSHRANGVMDSRQQELVSRLKAKYAGRIIHVPVWVNKDETLGRENTQRSRSFLFAALGAVVAESVRAGGISFFENGVVSLNLPLAEEVLRARASRTTHPRTLELMAKLLSLVADRPIAVDNPFIFKTKGDVATVLNVHGKAELIGYSVSCAHTIFMTREQPHCGVCSQCIDRKIGVLAAGLGSYDPDIDYAVNVFTGSRGDDRLKQNMAVDYVAHAVQLYQMSEDEIATRFNTELVRAAKPTGDVSASVRSLVDLHKRHGEAVFRVVYGQLREHAGDLLLGQIDSTSMLGLIHLNKHHEPSWKRYCGQILALLQLGIPTACKTHKPKNEPHLQELCDGLLRAHDPKLKREFPFFRWAVVMTKPDWSSSELALLIELKYVRAKKDIRPITKDIAEDIVKYGDNNQRVLFVIYDPKHLILDEESFAASVEKRPTMMLKFIR